MRSLILCALILGVGAAACRKSTESPVPSVSTSPVRETKEPARAGPSPLVSLSANGQVDVVLYQGWPLLLRASILHPNALEKGAEPIPVPLGDARIQADRSAWVFQPASPSAGTLTLDADTEGVLAWSVAPEVTAALPEGTYRVTVSLGPGADSQSTVRVVRAPAVLSASEESVRSLLFASYHLLCGEEKEALKCVEERLARSPTDVDALAFQGDLLESAGRREEALQAYDRAVRAFYEQHPDAKEPPVRLLRRRAELDRNP